jgi:hypothetical protein
MTAVFFILVMVSIPSYFRVDEIIRLSKREKCKSIADMKEEEPKSPV